MNLLFKEFSNLDITEHEDLLKIRNSKYVKNNMKSNDIIKIRNHLIWVDNLMDDEKNKYYAVLSNNSIVGAVYITDINREKLTCTWGVYFKEKINPLVSSLSAFVIIERMFNDFNIKKISSEVKKQNISAYKFNINLGFEEEEEDDCYYKLFMNIDTWGNNKNSKIVKTIKRRLDKIEYQFI